MLTKVELNNMRGTTLLLPLKDPSLGYIVKDIQGLDPVKGTIISSPFGALDGSSYQSSRRENRNIIITIDLVPYYNSGLSVESLRKSLYSFFMTEQPISLKFFIDDTEYASISGRVESCDAPLFSKNPQMVISVICFDPDFISPNTLNLNYTLAQATTNISGTNLTYDGSVEAGFVATVTITGAPTVLSLRSVNYDGRQLTLSHAFAAGDVITISTVASNKYVKRLRGGITKSILDAVTVGSTWPVFKAGVNNIKLWGGLEVGPSAHAWSLSSEIRHGGL